RGGDLRPDEYWNALRVRAGLPRGARAARQGARPAAAVQGAVPLGDRAARRGRLPVRHDRPPAPGMGTLRRLADHRSCAVRDLRISTLPPAAGRLRAAAYERRT